MRCRNALVTVQLRKIMKRVPASLGDESCKREREQDLIRNEDQMVNSLELRGYCAKQKIIESACTVDVKGNQLGLALSGSRQETRSHLFYEAGKLVKGNLGFMVVHGLPRTHQPYLEAIGEGIEADEGLILAK